MRKYRVGTLQKVRSDPSYFEYLTNSNFKQSQMHILKIWKIRWRLKAEKTRIFHRSKAIAKVRILIKFDKAKSNQTKSSSILLF